MLRFVLSLDFCDGYSSFSDLLLLFYSYSIVGMYCVLNLRIILESGKKTKTLKEFCSILFALFVRNHFLVIAIMKRKD